MVNGGRGEKMETIVIEILSVFDTGLPVTRLAVYRDDENDADAKLIVVSRDEIRSIALQRCHLKKSCRFVSFAYIFNEEICYYVTTLVFKKCL